MYRRKLIGATALAVVTAGCIGDDDESDDTEGDTNGEQHDDGTADEEQPTDSDDTAADQEGDEMADGGGETTDEEDEGGDPDGEPQLRVDVGDATGSSGDEIDVSLSVEAAGDDAPDEIRGHEFRLDYDETLLEPQHEPASSVTLESDGGSATYTIGADPDDGRMIFSTLDSPSIPFGPGETFTFEVLTDEAATATITASLSLDVDDGGDYVVTYDDGTVELN